MQPTKREYRIRPTLNLRELIDRLYNLNLNLMSTIKEKLKASPPPEVPEE